MIREELRKILRGKCITDKSCDAAIDELLNLYSVSERFGNEPSRANEKHINITVSFPTESVEIKETSNGTESVKIIKLNWG
tara:strand:- start:469 stop:711 length:243 start_codon:yes stop_codon:yes gene_type:complete